jgi:hypothetical protein
VQTLARTLTRTPAPLAASGSALTQPEDVHHRQNTTTIVLSDTPALALADSCRNEAFQCVPCVTASRHFPRLSVLCRHPEQKLGELGRNHQGNRRHRESEMRKATKSVVVGPPTIWECGNEAVKLPEFHDEYLLVIKTVSCGAARHDSDMTRITSVSVGKLRSCVVACSFHCSPLCHHCPPLSTMLPVPPLLLSSAARVICATSRFPVYVAARIPSRHSSSTPQNFVRTWRR